MTCQMFPQVLLALRWMPRCSAMKAAPITKMNNFTSLQASSSIVLHQVFHMIIKFPVFDDFSGVWEAWNTCISQDFSKELERQGDVFSISKDKASTASLDNPCQCLITITVRNCSLMFRGSFCISVCACCLLSFHWTPLRRTWLHFLYTIYSGFCTCSLDPYSTPTASMSEDLETQSQRP